MLNELSVKRFAKLSLTAWLWIVGSAVLIAAILFWWFAVQTQPKRVFSDMLQQSFRTNGVTIQAEQSSQGSNVQYWLQYSLGGTNQARSLTNVSQNGSNVTTEVLGTRDFDYTRYLKVETTQANEQGQPLDVSKVENVWAKTPEGGSALLTESALGLNLPLGALPIPISNLPAESTNELLEFIQQKNIYNVDYDNVETKRQDGRLQYVYPVKVQVILYADLLKRFAQAAGLTALDNLDPNSYSGTAPLDLKMTVDVRSHQLVGVDVAVAQDLTYSYKYTSYDIPTNFDIPKETIADSELQQRVQELQ